MPLLTVGNLPILKMSGTPAELGWEHGKVCGPLIQAMIAGFLRECESFCDVPYDFMIDRASETESYVPTDYLEEIHAIAEASDVPYLELLAWNCLPDIDACFMRRILQCCNFIVMPSLAAGEQMVHGRNLDFPAPAALHAYCSIIVARFPTGNSLPTISVGWVGQVGTYTGCNRAGLSIGNVAAPSNMDGLSGVPMGMILRRALEDSATVDGVAETIKGHARTCGFNTACADATHNTACCIESTPRLCCVRYPRKGYLVVDNLCLCPETSKYRLVYAAGVLRHARMTQLLEEPHSNGVDPLSLLKDRYDLSACETRSPEFRDCNTICNYLTAQSVVFSLAENSLSVSCKTIPAPLGEYERLKLDSIWGSR